GYRDYGRSCTGSRGTSATSPNRACGRDGTAGPRPDPGCPATAEPPVPHPPDLLLRSSWLLSFISAAGLAGSFFPSLSGSSTGSPWTGQGPVTITPALPLLLDRPAADLLCGRPISGLGRSEPARLAIPPGDTVAGEARPVNLAICHPVVLPA